MQYASKILRWSFSNDVKFLRALDSTQNITAFQEPSRLPIKDPNYHSFDKDIVSQIVVLRNANWSV
jgi:hypothetical protein